MEILTYRNHKRNSGVVVSRLAHYKPLIELVERLYSFVEMTFDTNLLYDRMREVGLTVFETYEVIRVRSYFCSQ